MTHLITMDLHQKEIQGFFDMPVDNLRASPFLIDYIQHRVLKYLEIYNDRYKLIKTFIINLDSRLWKCNNCCKTSKSS